MHLEKLVVFELLHNVNTNNWGGWKILKEANELKVLSLSSCKGLKRTPDFSGCLSLERLSLLECVNLQEVDCSIGKLKCLTHLDISHCVSLHTLPEDIGGLVKLKHFSLRGCYNLEKLPCFEKLTSLYELDMSGSRITCLPDSIGNAKHLASLNLSQTPIVELPQTIGELTQLEFLSLSVCFWLRKLPESIGNLTSLQTLDLFDSKIDELPDSIKNLKRLKVMQLRLSTIKKLPATIGMLERLEELNAEGCQQLRGELPAGIGELSSLSVLNMSHSSVCAVPTTISSLTRLQKMDVTYCYYLQELPKLPSSLSCLRVRSTSLRLVPNLSNLTNLVELLLSNDSGQLLAQASNPMQTLQLQWIGKLSKLKNLELCLDVPVPITELGCLTQLRELTFFCMDCFDSTVVGPQFSNFNYLSRLGLECSSLREIQLDGLELLRDLTVEHCEFLEGLSIVSSSMRKLCNMKVLHCPKLLVFRFLGMMELLEMLHVDSCLSLGGLLGLSNAINLEHLSFQDCHELKVVEGLEELKLLEYMNFSRCESFEMSTNVSKSKIPNECFLFVDGCPKLLLDENSCLIDYKYYKAMILRGTTKPFNQEDEMEENDHVDCSTGILECICNPLSFFQGRSPRRQTT